jgi:hypothetical protein
MVFWILWLVKTEEEDLERSCFWMKRVRMAWTNTTMTAFQNSHLLISVDNARVIRCMSTYNADLNDTVLQNRLITRHILAATPLKTTTQNLFSGPCVSPVDPAITLIKISESTPERNRQL